MNFSFQNDAKLLRLTANMRFRFASPKLAYGQLRIFAER